MTEIYDSLRYNHVRQKSVHNAFQRMEGISDQVLFWGARSLEFDLHRSGNDWKIYHFLLDPESSVERLSDALAVLSGVNRALPNHEVLTVFLDLKDLFRGRSSPRRLDELILGGLGRAVYTPRDLGQRAPDAKSLQEAVQQAGWPTLQELRGRFLFVLTGPTTRLDQYQRGPHPSGGPVAFVAPSFSPKDALTRFPEAVFFNLADATARRRAGPKLFTAGYVSRSYYLDDGRRWQHARRYNVHHLATDKVNEVKDRWSHTRSTTGWPFERIGGRQPRIKLSDPVHTIEVRSGDVWGREDSGYFRYAKLSTRSDRTWSAFVASPNSHSEEWAKAGLVARTDLSADAAYFGVFRVAQDQPLRVQYRLSKGADTVHTVRPVRGTVRVDSEDLGFVRLRISEGGRRARAWGSATGRSRDWVLIDDCHFEAPLAHQGLWASSKDRRRPIRFVFVPLGTFQTLERSRPIGRNARGRYLADEIPRGAPSV